jgi:hypothetical protein
MLFDIFPSLLLSREKEVPVGTGGNGRERAERYTTDVSGSSIEARTTDPGTKSKAPGVPFFVCWYSYIEPAFAVKLDATQTNKYTPFHVVNRFTVSIHMQERHASSHPLCMNMYVCTWMDGEAL